MRLAALCRCGRCGGPRRWSFSAGARAGPPVSRSARHASMLLALPDRGSPWEPSRDCLPDEIAEERVADGVRVVFSFFFFLKLSLFPWFIYFD